MSIYLFKSARLGYKPIAADDHNYFILLSIADPNVWSTDFKKIDNKIKNDIKHFNDKKYGAFLVFEIESDKFIGRAGFGDIQNDEVEVGYIVLHEYQGKGYATEMLKALLLWAKDYIKKDRILSITSTNNAASERVMHKAGMKLLKYDKFDDINSVIYDYRLKS